MTGGPAHDARSVGARCLLPGVTTGLVASAPSAAATGSALLAACGSCLGLGSSVAAGTAVSAGGGAAAGAATGAAGETGPGAGQLLFAAAVFAVLALLQVRSAFRGAPPPGAGRARFVLRRVAPSLAAAAVAFVAVQLLVVPWLAVPPPAAGPVLP